MEELRCPWCEVELPASCSNPSTEQTCPECRTTWLFEDEPADLALAA